MDKNQMTPLVSLQLGEVVTLTGSHREAQQMSQNVLE